MLRFKGTATVMRSMLNVFYLVRITGEEACGGGAVSPWHAISISIFEKAALIQVDNHVCCDLMAHVPDFKEHSTQGFMEGE